MDIKELRLKRMIELIERHGQKKVADEVGIDTAYISQLKNPKNPKNIGEKLARRIEEAFGLSRGWMDQLYFEQSGVAENAADYMNTSSNVTPALEIKDKKIPVVSWVQAGTASEAIDLFQPGEADDWVTPSVQVRAHTYALKVQGDSMAPDFRAGMILVVEPEMDYLMGDYVIARNGDDEATFKQYIKDSGQEYLKPINPQYPMIPLGTYRVIGVVREVIRKFR